MIGMLIASLVMVALIAALGMVFAFYLIVMTRDKSVREWSNGGRHLQDD